MKCELVTQKMNWTKWEIQVFKIIFHVHACKPMSVVDALLFVSFRYSILCACGLINFGKFVKFYVKKNESTTATAADSTSGQRDAFAILMRSSREQSARKTLPSRVTVRNKKDELYNAIITFFEKEELKWNASEVERGTAGNTVLVLRDTLWYIDGHHCKLAECSCTVPIVFKQFSDYNLPQMSKHRKRANTSLSAQVLHSHSQRIFTSLQLDFGIVHVGRRSKPKWRYWLGCCRGMRILSQRRD